MTILYRDQDCAVAVKPAGVSSEDIEGGMPSLIRQELGRPDAYVAAINRLDTPVSGLMVYALSKKGAASLSAQAEKGDLNKEYLCVCAGKPAEENGDMHDHLFKDGKKGKVFVVRQRKGSKEAILHYQTLCSDSETSLCAVQLVTGRTHQIRVQFASRKMPLWGDGKYGSKINGQMQLFCVRLSFRLPSNGKEMFYTYVPENLRVFREEASRYLSSSLRA